MSKPLLVTDRGLANLPITQNTLDLLDQAGLGRAMFAEVDPNPNEKNLAAGLEAYPRGGHDGVIAFGGGSGLDLGKVVAFMCGQTRPVWDYEDVGDWWTRADADKIAPIICVPTTAGTGSEVGRAGVLSNSVTHEKKIIFHPKMLAAVVICDPELTVGMPKMITAGTGMDAFAHCLEAYCSPHYHPMSQGIALEGMRLVKEYLPRAFADGNDIEARAHMMSAAAMGATAFHEGPWRDPRAVTPDRRVLQQSSRHHQRRRHGAGPEVQPRCYRDAHRSPCRLSRHRRRIRWLLRLRG